MANDATVSTLSQDDLRLEIAVLQEDIDAFNMDVQWQKAKFKIPSVLGAVEQGDTEIELYVPFEYTFAYGADVVPKGTEFVIAFLGADINNPRIIGRLTPFTGGIQKSFAKYIVRIIELRDRQQALINYSNMNDFRVLADLSPICKKVMEIMNPTYGDEFKIDKPNRR